MTSESVRYWFNRDTGVIHRSSSPNCSMTYNSHEKADWGGVRANWWGPFESLGVAIDVAASTLGSYRLGQRVADTGIVAEYAHGLGVSN